MMKRQLPLFLCAAVVAGAAGIQPAFARPPRIALTRIAGDVRAAGTPVTEAVTAAIDDGSLVIVPAQRVERAIERLGLDARMADREVARLADELEVDAVVRGAFDRQTRRMRFTIFANGRRGPSFIVQAGDPRSARFRAAVHAAVVPRLVAAVPPESKRDARLAARLARRTKAEARARDAGGKRVAREDSAAARPGDGDGDGDGDAGAVAESGSGAASAGEDLDSRADGEASEDGEDIALERAAASESGPDDDEAFASGDLRTGGLGAGGIGRSAARVDLGMSASARTLRYDAPPGMAPPLYRNPLVPAVRAEGEIYPFALTGHRGWLAGLGIGGVADQTFGLTVPSPAGGGAALPTTERHYSIGARYRFAFGELATSPTLTVGAGYGARTFVVERGGLVQALDVPDVAYRFLDPGAAFRLPLGDRFAVTLAGRALLVVDAGPIQRPDQYGAATLFGGSGSVGVEIHLADHVALRIAGEAAQLALSFAGGGALANRDGDASTSEVRGATDRYLGGAATLAIVH